MPKTIIITIFCLCVGMGISAQNRVSGHVTDTEGLPLEFANISMHMAEDSSLVKGAITDAEGSFDLMTYTDGHFFVKVSFIGYTDAYSAPFALNPSTPHTRLETLVLGVRSTDLDQVTVSVQRPFIERRLDKLIVNVGSSSVSSGSNALELLEQSPNVFVDQNDQIRLKGRQGVIIMIDDRRVRLAGNDLANMLKSMPSASIETIEIITNPSARYEAEGNAGIINFRSKRMEGHGLNGSTSVSFGQGKYEKLNASLHLNYRGPRTNVYGSLSGYKGRYYNELLLQRTYQENGQPAQVYDQDNFNLFPGRSVRPRIGLDYFPSKRTTIGILANGNFFTVESQVDNQTDILNMSDQRVGRFTTDSDIENKFNNYNVNANVRQAIDDNGKVLNTNVDYARYWNDTEQLFNTSFFEGGQMTATDYLRGDHGGVLHLFAFTADYEHPIGAQSRVETGVKSSYVKADNLLQFYVKQNGEEIFDTDQSNHFIYKENINAAYVNWSRTMGAWNAQVGVRMEHTVADGEQVVTDSTFSRNYVQFFPSAFLNYELSENHLFGISVSRRIRRPSYNQLNPFRSFANPTTYREGNPFLRPQLTWSGEFSYTFLERFTTTFTYSRATDNITMVFLQNDADRVTVVTHVNLEGYDYFGMGLSGNFTIGERWTGRFDVQAHQDRYEGTVSNTALNSSKPTFSISGNNTFDLGRGFTTELGGFYRNAQTIGITTIHSMWQLNVGIQKRILDNRGSIRFNVRDIFFRSWPRGTTLFANIDETFEARRDRRVATLSFNWRFGKQQVQSARRRHTGMEDEMRRAGQSSG